MIDKNMETLLLDPDINLTAVAHHIIIVKSLAWAMKDNHIAFAEPERWWQRCNQPISQSQTCRSLEDALKYCHRGLLFPNLRVINKEAVATGIPSIERHRAQGHRTLQASRFASALIGTSDLPASCSSCGYWGWQ